MIFERAYLGIQLDAQRDHLEQIQEYREGRRFVNERALHVGRHPIPLEEEPSPGDERRFSELQIRVFPKGYGEVWGRLRRPLQGNVFPIVTLGIDETIVARRQVSTTELTKLFDVSERFPTYLIVTTNSREGTRRLWREYSFEYGESPNLR